MRRLELHPRSGSRRLQCAWHGIAIAVSLACAACAGGTTVPGPTPLPADAMPDLPMVPAVDDDLRLTVIYPPDSLSIAAADSNFIFGATGSGQARLRINGTNVPVAPNGAYLAFLPVPQDGVYRLEATKGTETTSLVRHVLLPATPASAPGTAALMERTAFPTGPIALPDGEPVEVGFTGPAGRRAFFRVPGGRRIELVERPVIEGGTAAAADFRTSGAGALESRGFSYYEGVVPLRTGWTSQDGVTRMPELAVPPLSGPADSTAAILELVDGADTIRTVLRSNAVVLPGDYFRTGVVTAPQDAPHDWTARGRAGWSGPFHWFWPSGTRLWLSGESNGMYRVRLTANLSAWVPVQDVALQPEAAPLPEAIVSGVRMAPVEDAVDLTIATGARLPFRVDGTERTIEVTVYGATSAVNFLQYGGLDPLIERASWSQAATGEFIVSVDLTRPVWGYQVGFDAGDRLVIRIRRPPTIDPGRPLAGLLVAVDAGHPPGGSTGPTGLTEAEANLGVARELKPLLEAAGARVLMTRTDDFPVELGARPRLATDMNADILISLHNNAFPDGVNPLQNNGTSTYYFQPHSVDLAQAVQAELLAELRLRDLGIGRADLALVRTTWMPSVLSETMFLMIPQQEAALRDPGVRRRMAQAHVRALERFLRRRARQ